MRLRIVRRNYLPVTPLNSDFRICCKIRSHWGAWRRVDLRDLFPSRDDRFGVGLFASVPAWGHRMASELEEASKIRRSSDQWGCPVCGEEMTMTQAKRGLCEVVPRRAIVLCRRFRAK